VNAAIQTSTGLTPPVLALFRELGDLKRIRSAEAPGSVAERLFARAWAALFRGEAVDAVMARTTAAALAAARLGDLDLATLQALGLSLDEAAAVLERAFDEVAGPLAPALVERLRPALAEGAPAAGDTPDFALRLARQPRAGVTCPGKPRILLQPAETHAEHCLMVAVYGVIACGPEGADPAAVFLSGLAHHFHNVAMPDSGFTGEILLGAALDGVIARAREAVLASLPPALQAETRAALAPIGGDATAEARAFHVADVLDRVLEIEQHLRASEVTMAQVLGPYALVHDGPVAAFHAAILNDAGLHP
jgi:5'-deoxynucleotidase YfbR-like HD superfamily hydrolase